MKKQQLRSSVLSISGFLVLIGIIVAVNFIAAFVFLRFDLTQNRIYSLSKFSKKLVRELEDPPREELRVVAVTQGEERDDDGSEDGGVHGDPDPTRSDVS